MLYNIIISSPKRELAVVVRIQVVHYSYRYTFRAENRNDIIMIVIIDRNGRESCCRACVDNQKGQHNIYIYNEMGIAV